MEEPLTVCPALAPGFGEVGRQGLPPPPVTCCPTVPGFGAPPPVTGCPSVPEFIAPPLMMGCPVVTGFGVLLPVTGCPGLVGFAVALPPAGRAEVTGFAAAAPAGLAEFAGAGFAAVPPLGCPEGLAVCPNAIPVEAVRMATVHQPAPACIVRFSFRSDPLGSRTRRTLPVFPPRHKLIARPSE